MSNKFVLNADDFGMSNAYNRAVSEGYPAGILKSASLAANGEAFNEAVNKIIPECPDLGIGVHLNIIEGKSLCEGLNKLTDSSGNFNNSYGKILLKAFILHDKTFLEQIEKEFRAQIEKIKNTGIEITHLDSHVHTHSIPPIFNIVCRLAKEYGIEQVRTQHEKFYVIPDVFVHLQLKYYINIIKICLLNLFTFINKKTVKKYGLKTNDYIIGVGYTSMMSSLTVSYGLRALKNKTDINAEALIHPCRYENGLIDEHFTEYQITKNEKLKSKIQKMKFEITNYK